jgi:hypothetical protein
MPFAGETCVYSPHPSRLLNCRDQMLKQYFTETILVISVGFMFFYPPWAGVLVFIAALSLFVGLELLAQTKDPKTLDVESELSDLKAKVEQMILSRRQR